MPITDVIHVRKDGEELTIRTSRLGEFKEKGWEQFTPPPPVTPSSPVAIERPSEAGAIWVHNPEKPDEAPKLVRQNTTALWAEKGYVEFKTPAQIAAETVEVDTSNLITISDGKEELLVTPASVGGWLKRRPGFNIVKGAEILGRDHLEAIGHPADDDSADDDSADDDSADDDSADDDSADDDSAEKSED